MQLLRQFWLQSLLLIGLLAAVIWFIGPVVTVQGRSPLQAPVDRLLSVLVLVICWGLNNIRMQVLARHDERELMAGVLGRDSAQDEGGGARVDELERRLLRTIDRIRSQAGLAGRYLQRVPWFMFIGPPGAGKTTALANCRVEFQSPEGKAETALRGVGGTRDCEWWFSRQAVMIDTAGRYTLQEQGDRDQREWLSFIDLLATHRRGRPLNGVIVVISVQDLLTLKASQREAHASAIRRRLGEVQRGLGVELPVYILLTKADMLAGFRDTFGGLNQDERQDVWGVTLPLNPRGGNKEALEVFDVEFAALADRLGRRAFRLLSEELDPRRKGLIFRFPQAVRTLAEPLRHILGLVFSSRPQIRGCVLRGIYLSSGTQQGAPIDHLLSRVAKRFGFRLQGGEKLVRSRRSYFLGRLFTDVIFREAGGGVFSSPQAGGSVRGYRVGLAAIIIGSVCMLAALLGAAVTARHAMAEVAYALDVPAESFRTRLEYTTERARRLDRARVAVGRLGGRTASPIYWPMTDLEAPLIASFAQIARRDLLSPVVSVARRVALERDGERSRRALEAYGALLDPEDSRPLILLSWIRTEHLELELDQQAAEELATILERLLLTERGGLRAASR